MLQQVRRPFLAIVADGGTDLPAPPDALQAQLAHQPGDGAAGHGYALAVQLPPYLPDPVGAEVVGVDAAYLRLQFGVADRPGAGARLLAA
jgi:hypothetical protein